ncbi:MAG TPA: hypothetical protein VIL85_19110 [Thermomicrobiales bacterium]|jgi:hypothetical protein
MRADSPGHKLDRANRLVFTLVPLVLVVLIVGGFFWWQRPERNGVIVHARALAALPEGQLYYPGSIVLGQSGKDYEWGLWGSNPATAGALLGTNADPNEILWFYDRELFARGWRDSNTDSVVGTNEFTGAAYRKGRMAIQVSVLRPDYPGNPPAIKSYTAGYRITLIADRPSDKP